MTHKTIATVRTSLSHKTTFRRCLRPVAIAVSTIFLCKNAYNFGVLVGNAHNTVNPASADVQPGGPYVNDAPNIDEAQLRKPKYRLPNVLLAGVQKSGSSAVASLIFRAGVCGPEIFEGEPDFFHKEVHFFDKSVRYEKGPLFYAKRYRNCSDAALAMDATPAYFSYPERVRETYDAAGGNQADRLKIIIILRDPVARELSVYNHKAKLFRSDARVQGFGSDIAREDGKIKSFNQYVEEKTLKFINSSSSCQVEIIRKSYQSYQYCMGLYAWNIERWMKLFDAANILILSYDELVSDEEHLKWRIDNFLGNDGVKLGKIWKVNVKPSGHKIALPPCSVQAKLMRVFQKANDDLYTLMQSKKLPEMEQRPFPKFVVSNCTRDSQEQFEEDK